MNMQNWLHFLACMGHPKMWFFYWKNNNNTIGFASPLVFRPNKSNTISLKATLEMFVNLKTMCFWLVLKYNNLFHARSCTGLKLRWSAWAWDTSLYNIGVLPGTAPFWFMSNRKGGYKFPTKNERKSWTEWIQSKRHQWTYKQTMAEDNLWTGKPRRIYIEEVIAKWPLGEAINNRN